MKLNVLSVNVTFKQFVWVIYLNNIFIYIYVYFTFFIYTYKKYTTRNIHLYLPSIDYFFRGMDLIQVFIYSANLNQ